MKSEILVNFIPHETRVAVLEHGVLQELYIERPNKKGIVGNIYLGKIIRVLPGMQAAFVDIGLPKAAFMHASDLLQESTRIQDVLVNGHTCLVQVVREGIGDKGPRCSMRLSLPSRHLVLVPSLNEPQVSTRILDKEERAKLIQALSQKKPNEVGHYIARTSAQGVALDELEKERHYLQSLWGKILEQTLYAARGTLIFGDLPMLQKILRDHSMQNIERIRIDNADETRKALAFAKEFVPTAVDKIEYYEESTPLFENYGFEAEIQKALERKVPLKSGGYLVFDQAEALTAIDVNTGGFVGAYNADETIYKTNLEAAHMIARQLCLRNIGGIIIIDFIDMTNTEHQRQVLQTLTQQLASDPAKTKIFDYSSLGLIEMTRKRTRESLGQLLCENCPTCHHRGTVKTYDTLTAEIYREFQRVKDSSYTRKFTLMLHPSFVEKLMEGEQTLITNMEKIFNIQIELQGDWNNSCDAFDIVFS